MKKKTKSQGTKNKTPKLTDVFICQCGGPLRAEQKSSSRLETDDSYRIRCE